MLPSAGSSEQLVGSDAEDICQRVQLRIKYRPALALQQRERGNAEINAAKLELRKKLRLLHTARKPQLRHPRTDQVPRPSILFKL